MSYLYESPDTSLYSFRFPDPSFYSFGFSDPAIIGSLSLNSDPTFSSTRKTMTSGSSPPKHRHDGTSPLPLGMDWSPPPPIWAGRNSVWPHDPHTGWSYCVTIPSWIILPSSSGSDRVVFFRVQVGTQSPEGITTIRGILRRFNDFLKLFSDLQSVFPKKKLPPTPPRRLLRIRDRNLVEERRRALEDWMEKLLSDIDLSRTVQVAIFLELEAAARSSFYDSNQIVLDENLPANNVVQSHDFPTNSDTSFAAVGSPSGSDFGKDSVCETPELETPSRSRGNNDFALDVKHSSYNQDIVNCEGGKELSPQLDSSNLGVENLLGDNSLKFPEGIKASKSVDSLSGSDLHIPSDFLVALPSDERQKVKRVLITMQRKIATAKTDMEDLIARLNQELAVRQYLTTKVKDLEVELETTKQSGKENLQQAILNERERHTQMQWDTEDLRRNCMDLELKLKSEQDEKMLMESTNVSLTEQNNMLLQELDVTREKLANLQKHQEELELKSKSDVKLLVKEVKTLRSSQLELKNEVSRLMRDKLEGEKVLHLEKERSKYANAANVKLLHECEVLRNRLEECSVNFLIKEEDKLTIDASSPADAVDLLTTADNRIGLLLAEAQLLSQDVENEIAAAGQDSRARTSDDELRVMLTDIFIDNARLRKQVNSVIRCALSTADKSDEKHDVEEESSSRNTILSKFM